METCDMTSSQKDYAIFLPAISNAFVTPLRKVSQKHDYFDLARIPPKFEHGILGLNYAHLVSPLTKAVQELFRMAKRYSIPIITAQQINRETIRDARKAKEANKFMTYDQAAVSGGQVLLHLCTYAIAIEPNKEENYCILHPTICV